MNKLKHGSTPQKKRDEKEILNILQWPTELVLLIGGLACFRAPPCSIWGRGLLTSDSSSSYFLQLNKEIFDPLGIFKIPNQELIQSLDNSQFKNCNIQKILLLSLEVLIVVL